MTNLDAQIIYTNIIQFQCDPALTETILADLAGSNGPVDFERLCPLPPLPDQNPISLPEWTMTRWGSQTNALNSRIERLGDTTKLIFDTGGSRPYLFIYVLAQRYNKTRFVFKYFNLRRNDWGIEIWQDDGGRVSDRIDSHMLREQLQMEIRGERFPEPGVEWRPTPPPEFIRVKTTGHLANCPICQSSSLKLDSYSDTFQDPLAWEQYIRMDRANREWAEAFEQAVKESGAGFNFAQFWAEHGPRPDIHDSRFSVDGVSLADHWSRFCSGNCLKCYTRIWHDFVGDNWHYYYYPSRFATWKEGDAAHQVGSDKGKSVFTPPNLLRQITFEKVFRLSGGGNKHLNGSGGYYNGQAIAGVKYPVWPSVRRTFDNWYQGIKRRLPTPVGLFDKQPSPPIAAVDTEEMTYTPLEVAVEQILPYLPRQLHSSSVIVPFAGEGWMAYMVSQWNGWPICVEASPSKAAALRKKGYGMVVREDFRTWPPFVRSSEDLAHGIRLREMASEGGVWRNLYGTFMFPPLEGGSDVRRVMHALPFQQEPGTVLVAIMHEASFSEEHTPALAFRAWLNGLQGWSVTSQPLPSGTIKRKEDGVNIPVRLVTFTKEADEQATGSREEEIVQ